MPTAFTTTYRSLNADRLLGPGVAICIAIAMFAAWFGWACTWPLVLREVSSGARLEVDGATVPIQTPFSGKVIRSHVALGQVVNAGDALVELDSNAELLQQQEERTRAETLRPAVVALQAQIAAHLESRIREAAALEATVREAAASRESAEARARFAAIEAARLQRLYREGLVPLRELEKVQAEAAQLRAAAEKEGLAAARLEAEYRTGESDREAAIQGLQSEIARIQGLESTSLAAVRRLANEVERRVVRAPVSGRVGEAEVLRPGGYVSAGQRIAAIIPEASLIVVAYFEPAAALGRIAEGQTAELRLEGFPWAQWGTVPLLVSRVASEIREGKVRVEFIVDPARPCRIPLRHGMPGSVEVQVDRVTPIVLALRLAGHLWTSPRSAYPVPQ